MIKKLSILFAILFMGLAVSAQTNMRDVVHLKNGGITKGIIIEQIPNESIKIQTADGSIFVYKMEEVEKMTKESIEETTTKNSVQRNGSSSQNVNPNYLPPRKSVFGAGFLSFLIPGAGELYATNWEKGWGTIGWTLLAEPALLGFSSIFGYEGLEVGLVLVGITHIVVWLGSISEAVKLAKITNWENGYMSFQINDKVSLGFRPELSYNNLMLPSGSMSPQLTTGLGLSLRF